MPMENEKKSATGIRLILGYLGLSMVGEGLVSLFPLAILLFYPQEWAIYLDFLVPSGTAMVLGFLLWLSTLAGRKAGKLARNEDAVLLTLLWIMAFALGAFPFYLTKFPALNGGDSALDLGVSYSESFFEATSGYTATGLTVMPTKLFLTGVDSSPYPAAHVFLFHRAWMQFIGGVGLVLLITSLISSKNNFKLFFAEGHNDRLIPNIGRNAKVLFGIYAILILIGSISLWLAGMTPFDAVCHSIGGIATGGFSTRFNSIEFYSTTAYSSLDKGNLVYTGNAIAIEIVTEFIMLAGATNFVLQTFVVRGQWNKYRKDIEVRTMFILVVTLSLFAALSTYLQGNVYRIGEPLDFVTSLRYNTFYIISSISTTGFMNHSLPALGHMTIMLGVLAMAIGGGMGSTAGGLKQYRVAILIKQFAWSIKNRDLSPRYRVPRNHVRLGEVRPIDAKTTAEALSYLVTYLCFSLFGIMALLFCPNVGYEAAVHEWSTALAGQGADLLDLFSYRANNPLEAYNSVLWILNVGMLLGRLEIIPVLMAIRHVTFDAAEGFLQKRRMKKHATIAE